MSDKMKKVINSVKMGVKAALTPWEIATPDWADTNGDMGKWVNMDVTFKNDEKALDLVMETARGKEERNDIPLRMNWTPLMRKLKFTSTIKRLMDMRIISEYSNGNAGIFCFSSWVDNPNAQQQTVGTIFLLDDLSSSSCHPRPVRGDQRRDPLQ